MRYGRAGREKLDSGISDEAALKYETKGDIRHRVESRSPRIGQMAKTIFAI